MDFQKKTVELISNIKDLTGYLHYMRQFKSYLERRGFPICEVEGEKEWMRRWRKLSRYVDVYSYRFFSRYTDNPQGIVPENVAMRYIENLLNPLKYRKYFEDKNQYARYIPKEWMPKTIARRIGGGPILDGDYKTLKNSKLIIGGVMQ